MSRWFTAVSNSFRRRRMQRLLREFPITADTRILDIGGTPDYWRLIPIRPRLTLLNTARAKEDLADADSWVAADGRRLPFRDQSFDLVFSNSVIEHVGDAASQQAFVTIQHWCSK